MVLLSLVLSLIFAFCPLPFALCLRGDLRAGIFAAEFVGVAFGERVDEFVMEVVVARGHTRVGALVVHLARAINLFAQTFVEVAVLAPVAHLLLVVEFDLGDEQAGKATRVVVVAALVVADLDRQFDLLPVATCSAKRRRGRLACGRGCGRARRRRERRDAALLLRRGGRWCRRDERLLCGRRRSRLNWTKESGRCRFNRRRRFIDRRRNFFMCRWRDFFVSWWCNLFVRWRRALIMRDCGLFRSGRRLRLNRRFCYCGRRFSSDGSMASSSR